jgi:hypothetical protein
MPVGECLTIVIVLSLVEAQSREGDIIVGRGVDVVDASACDRSKAEVLRDGGQRIGPVTPVGVVNGGIEGVIVASPLGFADAGVAAKCYPVCDRANE